MTRTYSPRRPTDATTEKVAVAIAKFCRDPRHPKTIEWHSKAHLRNARDLIELVERMALQGLES